MDNAKKSGGGVGLVILVIVGLYFWHSSRPQNEILGQWQEVGNPSNVIEFS